MFPDAQPEVDPARWPFTSVILSVLDKHEGAARMKAPTLLWAYGASLDRHERAIMAMVEHHGLGKLAEVSQ